MLQLSLDLQTCGHRRRNQEGWGGTLETLLIFIHPAQIAAASPCILPLNPPKWNCFLRPRWELR